jgi:hypothetical protein
MAFEPFSVTCRSAPIAAHLRPCMRSSDRVTFLGRPVQHHLTHSSTISGPYPRSSFPSGRTDVRHVEQLADQVEKLLAAAVDDRAVGVSASH